MKGTGEFDLSIDASGNAAGSARVDVGGHYELAGELGGHVEDDDFEGSWLVVSEWHSETYDIVLTGQVVDGTIALEYPEDDDWTTISGTMEGERIP